MFYRVTLVVRKVYFHVTKTIMWFGIEEEKRILYPVLGICRGKNGSQMALQSLEPHFENLSVFDAEVKACWK